LLSRRKVLETERNAARTEAVGSLQVGAITQGKVTRVEPFGGFVDLGNGLEGLLHVSNISHQRIEDASTELTQGQEVKVKILDIKDGGKRIGLGIKQLLPDPWDDVHERFPADREVTGKVTRLADFGAFIEPLLPCLELHDLGNAKIAHSGSYPTDANWKLVVENFFECYHCQPSHPEYCQVHPKDYVLARGGGEGTGPDGAEEAYQPQQDAFYARAATLGHGVTEFSEDEYSFHFRGSSRTGIKEGWLSETGDGTPAAPLMGKFNDWDGGYTGISLNPLSTLLMTNDFATAFRFSPIDATHTDVEIIWMVRADSEEGKDYDKEKMIWLWDVTTIADKRIIEDNHAGVTSRRYQPGPYSDHERGTQALIHWYLNRLLGLTE